MEQLTPELERRLQVEELWVRRNVLADSINARRREVFRARHIMLSRLGTQALPLPAHAIPDPAASEELLLTPQMASPQPMRSAPARAPSALPRRVGMAGLGIAAGLMVMVGLQNADLVAGARAQFDLYAPRLMQMIYPHRAAGPQPAAVRVPVHARRGDVHAPDLRAEIAAQIAAAVAARP